MRSLPFLTRTALALAFALCANSASAAFHLWNIRELYTNSTGTLQYIEFFTAQSNQQFVANQQVSVSNIGGSITNTFTIPTSFGTDSANHAFIIGTAGLAAAGGPVPDFIIPNNFLFAAGGTINFFGLNSGAYTALPTNGTQSYNFANGAVATNTPQNYAGNTGTVVPEPTTWAILLAAGGLGVCRMFRRRA